MTEYSAIMTTKMEFSLSNAGLVKDNTFNGMYIRCVAPHMLPDGMQMFVAKSTECGKLLQLMGYKGV